MHKFYAGRRSFFVSPAFVINRVMSSSADVSRGKMWSEVVQGSQSSECAAGSAKEKIMLIRGCDPVMAAKSVSFLPPMLGGCTIVATTNDDDWFRELKARKYDVVLFAPGACRWDQAKKPIPGGNSTSSGWSLTEYHAAVREVDPSVPIVGSTEESEMIPLLRKALGLTTEIK